MRSKTAIFALMLSFFLIVSLPTFAQDNDKPASQDEKAKDRDRDKNSPQPNDRGAQQGEHHDKDARHQQNQEKVDRPQQEQEEHQRHEARPENESRPQQQRNEHVDRNDQQRPMEGRRVHIPDDRFRVSFGREHRFHVDRARIYQQQQPIVVYSGYTFQLVEPWPAAWAYDDDCYIDYDNVAQQYYLYDAYHPGFRVEVFVVGS